MKKWLSMGLGACLGLGQLASAQNMGPNGRAMQALLQRHLSEGLHSAEDASLLYESPVEGPDSAFFAQNRERTDQWLRQYEQTYWAYRPRKSVIRRLQKADWTSIQLLLVGGNWCPDTQAGIPALMRVLDLAFEQKDCNPESLWKYLPVDRNKQALQLPQTPFDFESFSKRPGMPAAERVPTAYLYFQGLELGSIVEFPTRSWEEDCLDIVEKAKSLRIFHF
ncbi:MAG: hypothetical protein ACO3DK_02240 [Bacteroidia bacterium]